MSKLGKSRKLDIFYLKSKKYNFRSRAAFKLIEIEDNFNFIKKAKCVIDLCSFPGSWIQVVKTFSGYNYNLIGVDLKSLIPIDGTNIFKGDITCPGTLKYLKKAVKKKSTGADLILNDASPRIGTNWLRDSYIQNEIVLNAAKIAIHCLLQGGNFITKIFRSKFTNGIIFLLKNFFKKIHMFKPRSSRKSSPEIYLVCQNFCSFVKYDYRIFFPEWILGLRTVSTFQKEERLKNTKSFKKFQTSEILYAIRSKEFFKYKKKKTCLIDNELDSVFGMNPLFFSRLLSKKYLFFTDVNIPEIKNFFYLAKLLVS